MMAKENWTVRKAEISDLSSIKELADAHKSELGFVLQPTLERAIRRDEIIVAINGTELLGFVHYHHRRDNQTTLYSIVVCPEFRRQGIGQQLLQSLIAESRAKGKELVKLKCPENLPANAFYESVNFRRLRVEPGKTRRLIVWSKPTNGTSQR